MGAEQIIGMAISNGIFATLFVFLLFYVLKDARAREKKYCDTIKELTHHLGDRLEEIGKEIGTIKTKIDKINL